MNLLLHSDPQVCEEFLELLGIPAGVACVDDEGFTLFANNALAREFYQVEPFLQPVKLTIENVGPLLKGVRDPLQVRVYVERMKTNYQACVDSRRALSTETEMLGADGLRWGRNTLTPLISEGRVVRLLVTFVDVTEIREAKDALERSLSALLAEVVTVCSECERIEDGGSWVTMVEYMQRHSDREFTHGICDKCSDQIVGGD